jgi:hypothetical protein
VNSSHRVHVADLAQDNVRVFTDPTNGEPMIASVTLTSGKRTAMVAIAGTVFGQVWGTGYFKFGAMDVTRCISWSSTSIVRQAPKIAAGGGIKVWAVTPGGTCAPRLRSPAVASRFQDSRAARRRKR